MAPTEQKPAIKELKHTKFANQYRLSMAHYQQAGIFCLGKELMACSPSNVIWRLGALGSRPLSLLVRTEGKYNTAYVLVATVTELYTASSSSLGEYL
jgi:hypothetical protein